VRTRLSFNDTLETCGPEVLEVGHPHLSDIPLSLGTAGLSGAACRLCAGAYLGYQWVGCCSWETEDRPL